MLICFRKGSVLIDMIPWKFRNPDLKLVSYYATVRYLEFVNMNDSRTGSLPYLKNANCVVKLVSKNIEF